ncbi:MAG: 30S ribosomal protein S19e [Methanosarcinales archaeon]|nr:MAG: 30S ribosomal protein S19e [Methanosarcinales archaeon]
MTTIYDVPAYALINKVALRLEESKKVVPPEWAAYVKTGIHKELPPIQENWWHIRCASILRRIYIDGPVGVERLRSFYGGKQNRGSKPERFVKGSGSILRHAIQQLEQIGYLRNTKKGRTISPAGRSFLDNIADEVKKEVAKDIPGLEKY